MAIAKTDWAVSALENTHIDVVPQRADSSKLIRSKFDVSTMATAKSHDCCEQTVTQGPGCCRDAIDAAPQPAIWPLGISEYRS